MIIKGHAPGTILQFMHIRSRLIGKFNKQMSFAEIGSGKGYLSNLLLNEGNNGYGIDLNESACEQNKIMNEIYIKGKKYEVVNDDFLNFNKTDLDFIISCMVIEHIPDEELKKFIEHAKRVTKPQGKLIFLVPSNMKAWGIEDEIAGHIKRYSFETIEKLAMENELVVDYKCGLNYPISNWLLNLSNKLVRKNEGHLLSESEKEKTIYTGNRQVKFKTVFPFYLNIILNEITLMPFYFLQRINKKNEDSLVMYFELSKIKK